MGDVKLTWNGNDIVDISASGSKTLKTGGKYNPHDIDLVYTKPTTPPPVLQTKSATPSLSAQQITPDVGYDGLAEVDIAAITSALLASLDADFVAGNIKNGVDLFGLVGTLAGGDLKIFDKLAVDSYTCTSSTGGTASHSLGDVPNFVLLTAKSPIIPSNGNRAVQATLHTPTASMYMGGYQDYAQFSTLFYVNNNGGVSNAVYAQYNGNYGIRAFTSTTIRIDRPANNYSLGVGDYWLVTGVVKAAYCTTTPT